MQIGVLELERYRRIFGFGEEITEDHVREHLELEGRLAKELLASKPDERWAKFSRAYSELYERLPWLNRPEAGDDDHRIWSRLLRGRKRIFEVGSGKARLLRHLLTQGHVCVATEITVERGTRHLAEADGLEWHQTDGIHLADFEAPEIYDAVVSMQVVEHFHPEDLATHFSNAFNILKPGGMYLLATPHRSCGPKDVSEVLDLDVAAFLHLKEYNFVELRDRMRAAGFRRLASVVLVPRTKFAFPSRIHLAFCVFWDRMEARWFGLRRQRRRWRRLGKLFFIRGNVFLIGYKA